jgi:predicted nucleic acid-binding protein
VPAAVVDSGPIIALASLGHFALLRERFTELLIPAGVEREIIVQGAGRAHARELGDALATGDARVVPVQNQLLLARLRRPALSETDSEVIACAIEAGTCTVVADDRAVRALAIAEGLPLVGTVGLLTHARLTNKIPILKPLLDQLVRDGFRLDPASAVYRDALARVDELP